MKELCDIDASQSQLTPRSWTTQLLSVMWQFLGGLLELLQLAWDALRGTSAGLGLAAKKDDDLGALRQYSHLRKPPFSKRGSAPRHAIPVMVVGTPAHTHHPRPHHHHHPPTHPAPGGSGRRGSEPAHPGRARRGPSQQLQQQASAAAAAGMGLLSPRGSLSPAQPSGTGSPRHSSYQLPPHPHFLAAAAATPRPSDRPGGATLRPQGQPLMRHQSAPEEGMRQHVPAREGTPPPATPLGLDPSGEHLGLLGGRSPAVAAAPPVPGCPAIAYHELELGECVGEGGFARVFRARWQGQEVALKVLNPESSAKPSVLEEFRRELAVLASLPPHPNVLRLVGAVTEHPHLAVVTEFCSGGSLYALLHSPRAQLGWGQLVHMCLGAARGVHFLHGCGVLHRDLKSGNLLLGGDGCVKLADFGLSRMVQHAGPMTGGLGTYQWMAPEVLGHQRYSQKADVYSFAMVMWECASRQIPYTGMDGVQAALAVMNRGLRPEIPKSTPPPFARLMQACWAPTPDQRPDFAWVVSELESMAIEVQQQQQQQQQEEEEQRPGCALPRDERRGLGPAGGRARDEEDLELCTAV